MFSSLRSWFKGADTRCICNFIEWFFARSLANTPVDDPNEEFMSNILAGAQHCNQFLRQLYSSGLWMPSNTASMIANHGLSFLRVFNKLAAEALLRQVPRYQLVCKLHMFGHLCHSLRLDAAASEWVLNPLSFSCQGDEDFVGRICQIARACHGRTMHERTLQKYKVNLAIRW